MTHKLKKKTLHFIEAFWNDKNENVDKLHKNFFSKNIKIFTPIKNSIGIKFMQEINEAWLFSFPDTNLKINKINSSGDLVIVDWICKATHLQEFNGFSPEGKTLNYPGVSCFRFLDDKVSEYWCTVDMISIYQQLGFYLKYQEYEGQGTLSNNYKKLSEKTMAFEHQNGNLSRREVEVLSLWIYGFSAKGIASILLINYRTVQTIISNISYKCNCISKSELKNYVITIGFLYLLKDLATTILQNLCKKN